MSVRTLPS